MGPEIDQKIASMTESQLRQLIREVLLEELEPPRGRFYSPEELVTRNEFQAFIKLLDERHQLLLQLMNQRFEAQNQRFEALQQSIDRNFKWTSLSITMFAFLLSILTVILKFSFS